MSGKQKETHGEIVPDHGRRGKGRAGGRERNDAGEGELHGCNGKCVGTKIGTK